MPPTLTWLGHASFRIAHGDTVVYIDPWKLTDRPHDATAVLVSHSHYDHYSEQDIDKVAGPTTTFIAPADALGNRPNSRIIAPGRTVQLPGLRIDAVPAYNPSKDFHPQDKGWVGFLVEWAGKRIYYAGDTDLIPEMESLQDVDLALLPVGGTYTMSADEAASATECLACKQALPYHWGDIVGTRNDAEAFARQAHCKVSLLSPGQSLTL